MRHLRFHSSSAFVPAFQKVNGVGQQSTLVWEAGEGDGGGGGGGGLALLDGIKHPIADFADVDEGALVVLRDDMDGRYLVVEGCQAFRGDFQEVDSLLAQVAEIVEQIIDNVCAGGGGGGGRRGGG